jgi:hypothetical protein
MNYTASQAPRIPTSKRADRKRSARIGRTSQWLANRG